MDASTSLAGTPTRHNGAPAKLAGVPTSLAGPPTKLAGPPTRHDGAPTKLVGAPVYLHGSTSQCSWAPLRASRTGVSGSLASGRVSSGHRTTLVTAENAREGPGQSFKGEARSFADAHPSEVRPKCTGP